MLSIFTQKVAGAIAFLCYLFNTIFWLIPILILSFLKTLLPFSATQKALSQLLDGCASNWILVNGLTQKLIGNPDIQVNGIEELSLNKWYMVISNHQTWVDILVLQRVLNGKIPFLKFFLKKELIFVPFLGLAWWALDFPFMKRYSKQFLAKNPHMRGKDIETTKKACAKFKHKPVSVMNFVEGTRFTQHKHTQQASTFNHLLKPKAGGIAFALDAMNGQLDTLVNVTIYYPQGIPTFWQFISGQVQQIQVQVTTHDISSDYIGDYLNDKAFQAEFQQWINALWVNKDQALAQLKQASLND
ncbi:acyltransferase [Moritella sp. Urea-trap-13]|uniref:acyltransferase n=1 Tax=Moritella sp. Urea-trap-13 TaxID=2058327 RepID=UPI000C34D256|nr:acyltransferase [Moritella sp. Urea-trap-13]PKH05880.1 acyltransferase [Moritella sp. Urea-trap-13]